MAAASTDGRSEVARNAGDNLAGQLVPILVALGAMPFVVRALGPVRFGLLALAWTIFGYFALMDFGLGRAVTQRVAAAAADADGNPPIGTIARTAVAAQTCFGFVGATALWFAAPTLASLLVPGGGALEGEATTMLQLLAAGLPGLLAMNAQRAVLEGLSRFDLSNVVRAPFQALVFRIPLVGVGLGWSLVAIIAG